MLDHRANALVDVFVQLPCIPVTPDLRKFEYGWECMWMVVPMAVVGHKVAEYHDTACAATNFFNTWHRHVPNAASILS